MWRCGSTKQRVRLGQSRHLCCRRRRYTNTHAHCYSDRDCHGHCQRYCHCDRNRHGDTQPHCHSIAIANGHAATDAHTQSGAIGKAAPNAFPPAVELLRAKNFS